MTAGASSRARKLGDGHGTDGRGQQTLYGFVDDQGLDRGILAHKGGVICRDGVAKTGNDYYARARRPSRSLDCRQNGHRLTLLLRENWRSLRVQERAVHNGPFR